MKQRIQAYLKTIFAIFKRDMGRLAKNPIALAIVIGVCILPSLYSWYTIAAFWQPYKNTESIQIAIANEDAGATSSLTGQLNVGDEVVASLHENHELGWQFVDKDQAINGVYAGRYYAAIILPENFTQSFISLFSGTFTRPQIDYYVNEKLTGSGVKIVDTGANAVEQQIDATFVKTVSAKVIQLAQAAGLQIENAESATSQKLTAGLQEARRAVADTNGILQALPGDVSAAQSALGSSVEAVRQIQNQIPAMQSALQKAEESAANTRTTLGKTSTELGTKAVSASTAVAKAASDAAVGAGNIAANVSQANTQTQAALKQVSELQQSTDALIAQLQQETQSNPALQSALATLQSEQKTLASMTQTLSDASTSLVSTAEAISSAATNASNQAQAASATIQNMVTNAQTVTVPEMQASLDSLIVAIGQLQGLLSALDAITQHVVSAADALMDSADVTNSVINGSKGVMSAISASLDEVATDLGIVNTSSALSIIESTLRLNPDDVSSFLSAPVGVKTDVFYPVDNYGSGVAPFFTNLALWVAGFILMAMVRIKVDPTGLPPFTDRQAYFGRWLTYMVFGSVQGIIDGVGDLVLGVQCVAPFAFVFTCWLTAVVYVNLMFGLAYAMRHIGKAIAVILLILQIPGSSGMFPIQMLPSFYQTINPFLPFTYSINALRETIGGFYGLEYVGCMLVLLLVYLPLGFLVGLGVGYYGHNLNVMFDKKLRQTNLYMAEQVSSKTLRFRLRDMLSALMDVQTYRAKIIARAKAFRRAYPRLRKIGWVALFAVPVLMLIIMILAKGTVDTKIAMLAVFFVLCLSIMVALIILNYVDYDISAQLSALRAKGTAVNAAAEASPAKSATHSEGNPSTKSEGNPSSKSEGATHE